MFCLRAEVTRTERARKARRGAARRLRLAGARRRSMPGPGGCKGGPGEPSPPRVPRARFAVAAFPDAFAGFLAKRLGATSEFGAYLDPLADKAMLVSIYVTLGIAE